MTVEELIGWVSDWDWVDADDQRHTRAEVDDLWPWLDRQITGDRWWTLDRRWVGDLHQWRVSVGIYTVGASPTEWRTPWCPTVREALIAAVETETDRG